MNKIVFTSDNSFKSLGKRIFDVYVQGELKLKDFDIVKETGGTGRVVIKSFTANVKNNTLKIQFYWAGKGTTIIPYVGNYGPTISAISVVPNFKLPNKSKVGLIVGTFCGGLFIVLLIIILWRKGFLMKWGIAGGDLETGTFTLRQIKAATKNFAPSNKLGEGGFGAVYKGRLSDRTIIAVKQLSSKSTQGTQEFINEIGTLSALQHPNLVRLYGCSVEENQMSLIYEYMENNCLFHALLGTDNVAKAKLTWPVRFEICKGVARGLAYLHEESPMRIIHRDIKASNVLLDGNFNAKISDFGLARLYDTDYSHITTRVAGTVGYMAPEYAMRGTLSPKADVYSFGILILEIVTGKSNNYRPPSADEAYYLIDWAFLMHKQRTLLELVDPDLGFEYQSQEALTTLQVALLCLDESSSLRPTMSHVVDTLEGRTTIQDLLKIRRAIKLRQSSKTQFLQDNSEIRPTSVEEPTDSLDNSEILPLSVEEPTELSFVTEIPTPFTPAYVVKDWKEL